MIINVKRVQESAQPVTVDEPNDRLVRELPVAQGCCGSAQLDTSDGPRILRWVEVWLQKYDQFHGESARAALMTIIGLYFPEGRPPK